MYVRLIAIVSCNANPSYGEVDHHHYMSGSRGGRSHTNNKEYVRLLKEETNIQWDRI